MVPPTNFSLDRGSWKTLARSFWVKNRPWVLPRITSRPASSIQARVALGSMKACSWLGVMYSPSTITSASAKPFSTSPLRISRVAVLPLKSQWFRPASPQTWGAPSFKASRGS